MVRENDSICPKCGGALIFYDRVKRIVRSKGRNTEWIVVRRLKCKQCGAVHRELPELIFPYKQYEYEIIVGVIEGLITPSTYGYEDYPTELTMLRWTRNLHIL